ncbi:MAG: HPr family phosphocarrier protein [Tumebacillaceae bacterium]
MHTQQVTIQNQQGFHVRPAQLFVQTANQFQSTIKVLTPNGGHVDAKSILGLMTLGLEKGVILTIEAEGADEKEAVQALADLVDSKFGEE